MGGIWNEGKLSILSLAKALVKENVEDYPSTMSSQAVIPLHSFLAKGKSQSSSSWGGLGKCTSVLL